MANFTLAAALAEAGFTSKEEEPQTAPKVRTAVHEARIAAYYARKAASAAERPSPGFGPTGLGHNMEMSSYMRDLLERHGQD